MNKYIAAVSVAAVIVGTTATGALAQCEAKVEEGKGQRLPGSSSDC
ncbi:hypothetical protein [Arcanobacterium haemolyticum]|nr:hypothetical protein [Arcanobacterium haemolyticum]SPT75056.1 Uncharacterised protein [Arcanobacterium haemolyticum]